MLKKWIASSAVTGLLCFGLIQAAGATPKSDITIQPVGLLFGTAYLEYETALSGYSAGAVRLNYNSFKISDLSITGVGGGLSYRFYPASKGNAPKGFFVGPAVDVRSVSASSGGDTASTLFYSIAAEIGYRWMWGDETAFVLVPSINLGYNGGTIKVGDITADYTGMGVGVGLGLGIGF